MQKAPRKLRTKDGRELDITVYWSRSLQRWVTIPENDPEGA